MKKRAERNQQIVAMYLEGFSYREVGEKFGLTRQRIEQIVREETDERHRTNERQRAFDQETKEAFGRIMAQKSTVEEEAAAFGVLPDSLRVRFNNKGLLLPKHESKPHGTRYRYNRGCRCDECRAAMREDLLRMKRRGPKQHGTVSAYINYGCRCDACRKAGSVNNREYRERRKQRERLLSSVSAS